MMISAATPSNTQPKTCLTARDFMRPAISREPSWLPRSTATTLPIHTPHWGWAAVARCEMKLDAPELVTTKADVAAAGPVDARVHHQAIHKK